jgi:hypothetical protein
VLPSTLFSGNAEATDSHPPVALDSEIVVSCHTMPVQLPATKAASTRSGAATGCARATAAWSVRGPGALWAEALLAGSGPTSRPVARQYGRQQKGVQEATECARIHASCH